MSELTLEQYFEDRRVNGDKLAEYIAWLETMVGYGADYRRFSSAQHTHAQYKRALREALKLRVS